ncbi:MAG: hypothetical protein M0027_08815 [Candidatus Dormibacteraeota bacterium]|nr:hypothetical protein [Candidatus Dormibacteraeota bacterium]
MATARVSPSGQPEWVGPPDNVIPGALPLELLVAASQTAVVAVRGRAAYPTGFEFDLVARLRAMTPEDGPRVGRFLVVSPDEITDGKLPPRFLRFGLEFSDGRKVTNLPGAGPGPFADPGVGPILWGRDGSGSNSAWRQSYWVWPLPPPGPLKFVCAWPAFGIPESTASVDAAGVIDAATRATVVWPLEEFGSNPARGGSSWSGLQPHRGEGAP